MKKYFVLLIIISISGFSYAQEVSKKEKLEEQIRTVLETHDFESGNKHINNPTTKHEKYIINYILFLHSFRL